MPSLFLLSRPEEVKTKSTASVLVGKNRSDNDPSDVEPYILGPKDLRIHKQREPRRESFMPFHHFVQEPSRFLRNAGKLRRQEERRRALCEATCAARSDIPVGSAPSSRDTDMAEPREKARMQRSVSLLSWEPEVIEDWKSKRQKPSMLGRSVAIRLSEEVAFKVVKFIFLTQCWPGETTLSLKAEIWMSQSAQHIGRSHRRLKKNSGGSVSYTHTFPSRKRSDLIRNFPKISGALWRVKTEASLSSSSGRV